jgi:hypothetical protein
VFSCNILGEIVMVGIPFFFRGMLNLIRNVYQGRYEAPGFLFAPTLDKAHEMLECPEPVVESKPEVKSDESKVGG